MAHQKIRTFLWFDANAREAAEFYVSVFQEFDSAITGMTPGPNGRPLVVAFRLSGTEFLALNGGPARQLSEAVSLSVDYRSQEEVDELWEKLSAGGAPGPRGWLKDRFGLSVVADRAEPADGAAFQRGPGGREARDGCPEANVEARHPGARGRRGAAGGA